MSIYTIQAYTRCLPTDITGFPTNVVFGTDDKEATKYCPNGQYFVWIQFNKINVKNLPCGL